MDLNEISNNMKGGGTDFRAAFQKTKDSLSMCSQTERP